MAREACCQPVPFHVETEPIEIKVAGRNIFPLVRTFFANIPDNWRRNIVTRMHAVDPNNSLRDRYDCTGESPYTVEEFEVGKIWKVRYDMEFISFTSDKTKQEMKYMGLDPNSDEYGKKFLAGAEPFGETAQEIAVKDLEMAREWFNKDNIEGEDVFKVPPFAINAFVVKLASGSVLLYAPVKVRDETGFGQWLDSLGKVDWIIAASSYHTINLPAVLKRYPEAKIVGSPAAEAKLKHIDALPRKKFDFDSTRADDLKNANALLIDEGVQLFSIDGDVCSNSIVAIVDEKILLECDLIYTHDDGEGFGMIDQERFRQFLPEDWADRVFKFGSLCKPNSPNGFLAFYRFWFMDPNRLGAMMYDPPKLDGSSCKEMAESLREVLQLPFTVATGVHFNHMDRDKFRRSIDKNWNWLDGCSLIDE